MFFFLVDIIWLSIYIHIGVKVSDIKNGLMSRMVWGRMGSARWAVGPCREATSLWCCRRTAGCCSRAWRPGSWSSRWCPQGCCCPARSRPWPSGCARARAAPPQLSTVGRNPKLERTRTFFFLLYKVFIESIWHKI